MLLHMIEAALPIDMAGYVIGGNRPGDQVRDAVVLIFHANYFDAID